MPWGFQLFWNRKIPEFNSTTANRAGGATSFSFGCFVQHASRFNFWQWKIGGCESGNFKDITFGHQKNEVFEMLLDWMWESWSPQSIQFCKDWFNFSHYFEPLSIHSSDKQHKFWYFELAWSLPTSYHQNGAKTVADDVAVWLGSKAIDELKLAFWGALGLLGHDFFPLVASRRGILVVG